MTTPTPRSGTFASAYGFADPNGPPPTGAPHRVQGPQGRDSVLYVDPAYASRTCAECGHVDKANRVPQVWPACRSCVLVEHADRNDSRSIRARAEESRRRETQSTTPGPPPNPNPGVGQDRTQARHHAQ
ncbi:zinc ribbon domain-containing protein [Streptomyces sp. S3(2020)]|uniref:zinc ribbon domain-containing protein n=1 Tax=Streptomyces sp. S3(2020) TaxID=2732044 RepID=UPI003216EFA1